ncbi:hypothetical protein [Virgibacillus necropolis]|uniref:Uncharacterized protein n=1 Tax=Virgibacillus necropolis TaxID=163877 RepID=A0A221MB68_9BACI|nr:hypothetical protein [Virgibacillus necropolis]ASN04918.1 hypothetical protein CFK40_07770 [Virgibacillus necropolis]
MERLNNNLYSFENKGKSLPNNIKSNESSIKYSGNSDVDVSVLVDTTPMAYAMLCSLLATKQLSNQEFETAVRKLEELTKNNRTNNTNREKDEISKVEHKKR